MANDIDYAGLVKRAQLGDKEALDNLMELARERLREDVFRMTFRHDLTQDIVQETLLEMFKILPELKKTDRFWSWLYRIALNKLRIHRRNRQSSNMVPFSVVGCQDPEDKNGQEAMVTLVGRELKQIVLNAMQKLSSRHRAVLTMRCYRDMTYAEIAETLGCSEFAAKMVFQRAKKTLQKQSLLPS